MLSKTTKLFLERQTYRRRRIGDLIKLLPVFGVVLFAIPVFWGSADAPAKTSLTGLYVFATWAALVGILMVLTYLRGSGQTQASLAQTASDIATETDRPDDEARKGKDTEA